MRHEPTVRPIPVAVAAALLVWAAATAAGPGEPRSDAPTSGGPAGQPVPTGTAPEFEAFQRELDRLAAGIPLPGYSAAIVRDGAIVWAHAWGQADREAGIPATPDTPYRLASLSKPLGATLLMQLVEEKKISLDDPMKKYRVHPWFESGGGSWAHYPSRYVEQPITVRHVLTHTSQSDPPGSGYRYSGNIFADLTFVIEDVTRQSYPKALQERILDRAGMTRSLPGQLVPWNAETGRALAKPYKLADGRLAPGTYPGFGLEPDRDVGPQNLDPAFRLPAATVAARRALLGKAYTPLDSAQTAAGAISTVVDLARFDIALDGGRLIATATRDAMFTASRTAEGKKLPYGLGWFVEDDPAPKLVWHYGWFPPTVSALYVKVPERRLTFIVLANSDGISAGVPWTARGVRGSPIARLFLDRFVSPP